MDVTVWEMFGWDINSTKLQKEEFIPVGGQNWGENNGDQTVPTYHYTGIFSTFEDENQPSALWANGGDPKLHQAEYQTGVVVLNVNGGDVLRIAVGVVPCEGQLAQPYTFGDQIDGTDVNAAGWWMFRGSRLTAAQFLAGDDPAFDIQVAFCEWVSTSTGDGVEIDGLGYASIRIVRFEDPRRFGLPYDKLTESWASAIGALECSPMGLIGGSTQTLDWRHRMIPRTLLSSGTATFLEVGDEVTVVPGANQPGDLPPGEPSSGDVEVADFGLGIPPVFVDWASWWLTAAALPGGTAGPLNRATYPVSGSTQLDHVLVDAMRGRGLAWSMKRKSGGVVPAFGCFDPIKVLTLEDVEVTLTREDMGEPGVTDADQWRGVVDLRQNGPFDRFEFQVDGDPLSGSLQYKLTQESSDPGRRYRDGAITWPVDDRGLRDPTPWLGTPKAEIYDWTGAARDRFAVGFGQRYAKSTRVYTASYRGEICGRVGPGSIVHVIDSTAESADGLRGINHLGWVREASITTNGPMRLLVSVELQPRPVDALKVWAPQARADVDSWDAGASELTVREDWAGVNDEGGGGTHEDTLGFVQPPWSTLGAGSLRVVVYQSETGRTFPSSLEVRADVTGADDVGHVLTLSNLSGTIFRDTIKIVVAAPKDEQTAPWALALYIPITEPSGLWNGVDNGDRL
jgi:hypothetical protein